jgi:hypothetical protein
MFNRQKHLATFLARVVQRGSRAGLCSSTSVALGLLASSCALQVHEGDGLVSDGREIVVSPTLVFDAGRPDAGLNGVSQGCKQLALFEQTVLPLLLKKSEGVPPPGEPPPGPQACIDCHDGTKIDAFKDLAMDAKDSTFTCLVALVRGGALGDGDATPQLLSSSDPNRPDQMHDFKFKSIDDYNRFHEVVVAWLSAEKQ